MLTLDDIKEKAKKPAAGESIAVLDKTGRVRFGTIRIREIRCGKKTCTKCPHKKYAYARYRVEKKMKEKYIGVVR